jgi:hypothetical protein
MIPRRLVTEKLQPWGIGLYQVLSDAKLPVRMLNIDPMEHIAIKNKIAHNASVILLQGHNHHFAML